MIYTSYFNKLEFLPKEFAFVAITLGVPDWYKGPIYKKLAPTYEIFSDWKRYENEENYTYNFLNKVLNKLDPVEVSEELYRLTKSKDVCLLCYEKPTNFCHRHLVAKWFRKGGIACEEYK